MAAVSKATNKSKFQTGDVPTESDFIDLIDSYTDAAHASDTANPHSVTKSQVGLGSVDNTSDIDKPVSTAQQTAIDTAFSGVAVRLAAPVADLAALKAINTTSSTTWPDKIMILAEAIGQYRLDRDSSATGDDDGVVQPTTGVGRWIKLNVAGAYSTLSGVPDDNAALVAKFANYVNKETFTILTDGSSVTWDNLNRQFPLAKVTMASTARTLVMPNVKSGASGTLKIITSTASAITVTFDTNYTNKVQNVALTTFTFPAATGKEYFLYYIAEGTNLEWVIVDGTSSGTGLPSGTSGQIIVYNAGGVGTAVTMSGDCTISNTGVITIGGNKVTLEMLATLATGKVIGNLSGSTATPSALDTQDQLVSNSTVITALNTESGWSNGTKTSISNLLSGQTYEGVNLTDGLTYRYLCTVAGTATRIPIGQAVSIDTLPVKTPQRNSAGSTTTTINDHVVNITSNGTVTLHTASTSSGQELLIITDMVTPTVAFSGTVNGTTPTSLITQYSFLRIKSINNNWINIV